MEKKDKLILYQFFSLGVVVLFAVMVYHTIGYKNELKTAKEAHKQIEEAYLINIKELVTQNDMLLTAVLNMENKSMKTYSEPMQKMIIAAKQNHKIDFDFYLRMMQEKNKKP